MCKPLHSTSVASQHAEGDHCSPCREQGLCVANGVPVEQPMVCFRLGKEQLTWLCQRQASASAADCTCLDRSQLGSCLDKSAASPNSGVRDVVQHCNSWSLPAVTQELVRMAAGPKHQCSLLPSSAALSLCIEEHDRGDSECVA